MAVAFFVMGETGADSFFLLKNWKMDDCIPSKSAMLYLPALITSHHFVYRAIVHFSDRYQFK
jgi:hypothetical protein